MSALPEPPMRVLAKLDGDVKHPSLLKLQWWLRAPANVWVPAFVPDKLSFFACDKDLTVIPHPSNDERAVELIRKSKESK